MRESGTAPIIKNRIHSLNSFQSKGATPIEKNVIVVDEQGNEYEATYPKRAKGLVKNGRARFVDENKICLVCPPNINLEDNKMTEDIKIENVYNINYILLQIAKIQEQTEYLNNAIEKLSEMGDGECGHPGSPGNIQGQAKAQAMCDIVRCRETTNQQMLSIYEKMYDDLKPANNNKKLDVLEKLAQIAANTDDYASEKSEMLDSIRQIFRENFKD